MSYSSIFPVKALELCNALREAKVPLNGINDMSNLVVKSPNDNLQRLTLCLPTTHQAVREFGFTDVKSARVRFAFPKSIHDTMGNFHPKLEVYDANGDFISSSPVDTLNLGMSMAVELELNYLIAIATRGVTVSQY